jgi:hypothetical protein
MLRTTKAPEVRILVYKKKMCQMCANFCIRNETRCCLIVPIATWMCFSVWRVYLCGYIPCTRRVQGHAAKICLSTLKRYYHLICSCIDLHEWKISQIGNQGRPERRWHSNVRRWLGIAGRGLAVATQTTPQARAANCAFSTNRSRIEQGTQADIRKWNRCYSQAQRRVWRNVLYLHR